MTRSEAVSWGEKQSVIAAEAFFRSGDARARSRRRVGERIACGPQQPVFSWVSSTDNSSRLRCALLTSPVTHLMVLAGAAVVQRRGHILIVAHGRTRATALLVDSTYVTSAIAHCARFSAHHHSQSPQPSQALALLCSSSRLPFLPLPHSSSRAPHPIAATPSQRPRRTATALARRAEAGARAARQKTHEMTQPAPSATGPEIDEGGGPCCCISCDEARGG